MLLNTPKISSWLTLFTFAISTALIPACSLSRLPRNMSLKAFDPHRKEFTCNYEKAAEPPLNQEAEALFREGLALTSFDLWPDDRDHKKAAILWTKASEKDHWGAMLNLATLYLRGAGVERDTELAVQMVEKAMLLGVPRAFHLMVRIT
ncbi:tetratricopeptide repeat protein [Herbaspirillum frisingense]|uniref:tetratricopeptide repeat protein n=1 Tax=Herbaspirillum frisingense TaxID=92645 RepID=UPI0039AF4399